MYDDARFAPLSPQVFHVLLSLHHGPMHGYSIIQDIRERTGDEVRLNASTLYDALARLVDQGFIREAEGVDKGGDTRRRYYEITRLGRTAASREVERLERLLRRARATRAARKGMN